MTNNYRRFIETEDIFAPEAQSWIIGGIDMRQNLNKCFEDPACEIHTATSACNGTSNYQEYLMTKESAYGSTVTVGIRRLENLKPAKIYLQSIMETQTELLIETFGKRAEELKKILKSLAEPDKTTEQILVVANHIEFITDLKEIAKICHKVCTSFIRNDLTLNKYGEFWEKYTMIIIELEACFKPIADAINAAIGKFVIQDCNTFSIQSMMKSIFKKCCYEPFSSQYEESFKVLLKEVTEDFMKYHSNEANNNRRINNPEYVKIIDKKRNIYRCTQGIMDMWINEINASDVTSLKFDEIIENTDDLKNMKKMIEEVCKEACDEIKGNKMAKTLIEKLKNLYKELFVETLLINANEVMKKRMIGECEKSIINIYRKNIKANTLLSEDEILSKHLINSIRSVAEKLGKEANIYEMASILYENDPDAFEQYEIMSDEEDKLAYQTFSFPDNVFALPILSEATQMEIFRL